jgi:hypothetical protein
MVDSFKNILKFIRHHRYSELFKRLCSAIVKPLYENTAHYIVKLKLQLANAPDPSLNIKELTAGDIDSMLEVMYVSRSGLQRRFDRGDRCFAVVDNGNIISYFWARFGLKDSCELHLKFELKPHQAWMYNAITVRSARGRNLYPNVIRYMAKALLQSSVEEAFVDVELRNKASIQGLEKAGYKRLVLIHTKRLFSKTRYHITVFDADGWKILSQTIQNFENLSGFMKFNFQL